MRTLALALAAALAAASPASAAPDHLYARFVDTGPGLCVVIAAPGPGWMVYDAGHWQGERCLAAVEEIVPEDATIDLLVISHADGDHLGDANEILERYEVQTVLRTGYRRTTASWRDFDAAVADEVAGGGVEINLSRASIPLGTTFDVGDARATFVFGRADWTAAGPTASERRNAISIVIRLDYAGNALLLTGDTVGRRLDDPDDACKDAEALMVAGDVPLPADVLQAPHHGGNNGSATCFIEAVAPDYVIFSAGHDHHHPSSGAAGRYLAFGLPPEQLFRTDRGDDEGGHEWRQDRVPGCTDGRGDDDVEVFFAENAPPVVRYRVPVGGC